MGEVLKDFCVVNFLNYSTPPFFGEGIFVFLVFFLVLLYQKIPRLKTLFFFQLTDLFSEDLCLAGLIPY